MITHKQLVSAEDCIRIKFPAKRPSLRTFRKWQSNGWFPVHKIGHLTFFDPEEVHAALDQKFSINPAETPLTRGWNPIATGVILSAGNLVAVLAAVSNLTAQIIVIFTQ